MTGLSLDHFFNKKKKLNFYNQTFNCTIGPYTSNQRNGIHTTRGDKSYRKLQDRRFVH